MIAQITRPNEKNWKAIYNSLRRFFYLEIIRLIEVELKTTMRSLSLSLNKDPGYIEGILRKRKFNALMRLYVDILEFSAQYSIPN